MAAEAATKENFEQKIEENELVLIDFWADWCGPCKAFAPTFESASEKHPEVKFLKVNTDEEPELAQLFGVRGIPTLVGFKEQIGVLELSGALPEEALTEIIGKMKELDMNEVRAEIAKQQGEQGEQA